MDGSNIFFPFFPFFFPDLTTSKSFSSSTHTHARLHDNVLIFNVQSLMWIRPSSSGVQSYWHYEYKDLIFLPLIAEYV